MENLIKETFDTQVSPETVQGNYPGYRVKFVTLFSGVIRFLSATDLIGFHDFTGDGIEDVTVADATDGALIEGHDVLRQRSCFVGEDVLDLAELLVQRGGARLGRRLGLVVEHLLVPVDEEGLSQPDDLDADVERDGHNRVKHDGVRKEDEQRDDGGATARLGWDQRVPRQVRPKILARRRLPHAARDRCEQAHREQKEHDLPETKTKLDSMKQALHSYFHFV